jgi:hypothetical protein
MSITHREVRLPVFAILSFLLILVICLPVIKTSLNVLTNVSAQAPSEAVKVLLDDAMQALRANDVKKANVYLSILNQQLQDLGSNSASYEPTKVLLDDATSALINGDNNKALVHLNLAKQLLTSSKTNIIQLSSNETSSLQSGKKSNPLDAPMVSNKTTSSTQAIRTKIFNLSLQGLTFPIHYNITGDGNKLYDISREQQNADTLVISIGSQSGGKLIVELPRTLVDSISKTEDYSYQVFIDGNPKPAKEVINTAKVRTLAIDFDKGSNQIEIQIGIGGVFPCLYNPSFISDKPPALNPNGENCQNLLKASTNEVPSSTSGSTANHQVSTSQGASDLDNSNNNQRFINICGGNMTCVEDFTKRGARLVDNGGNNNNGGQSAGGRSTIGNVADRDEFNVGYRAGAVAGQEAANKFDTGGSSSLEARHPPPCPGNPDYCKGFRKGFFDQVVSAED